MKHYADKNTPGFKGCEETIRFIKKINDLVDAMNSRLPSEALYANKDSKHYKVSEENICSPSSSKRLLLHTYSDALSLYYRSLKIL